MSTNTEFAKAYLVALAGGESNVNMPLVGAFAGILGRQIDASNGALPSAFGIFSSVFGYIAAQTREPGTSPTGNQGRVAEVLQQVKSETGLAPQPLETTTSLAERLNALREANADKAAALEAFARATLETQATQAEVAVRIEALEQAMDNNTEAEFLATQHVAEAEAEVTQALNALDAARAKNSDTALKINLADRQSAVDQDDASSGSPSTVTAAELVIDLADVLAAGIDPDDAWSATGTLTINGKAVSLAGDYAPTVDNVDGENIDGGATAIDNFLNAVNDALDGAGIATSQAGNIVITTTAKGSEATLSLSDFAITQAREGSTPRVEIDDGRADADAPGQAAKASIELGNLIVDQDNNGTLNFELGTLRVGHTGQTSLSTGFGLSVGSIEFTVGKEIEALTSLGAGASRITSARIVETVVKSGTESGNEEGGAPSYVLEIIARAPYRTEAGGADNNGASISWSYLAVSQPLAPAMEAIADSAAAGSETAESENSALLNQQLLEAQAAWQAREELIAAVAKAETDLKEAEAAHAELKALLADVNAAAERVDEYAALLADKHGIQHVTSLENERYAGAVDESDVYLFTAETGTAVLTHFEDMDSLFLGSDFARVDLQAGVDITSAPAGNADTLEVFFQQNGDDTTLFIEQFAGAGNAQASDEFAEITLVGVSVEALQFANGQVTLIDAA